MAQCQQDLLSGLLKLGHQNIEKQEWIAGLPVLAP